MKAQGKTTTPGFFQNRQITRAAAAMRANIQNTTSQSVLACLACFTVEFFVGCAGYRLWRIGDACTTKLVP